MTKSLNLKIYGITTVGPKGQVIISKECRNDFDVKVGSEFEVVIVNRVAFGLGSSGKCEKNGDSNLEIVESQGLITLGTKFQFVIPNNIRKELGIEPKDSLIIIGHGSKGLGFIKNDKIEYLLDYIKKNTSNKS